MGAYIFQLLTIADYDGGGHMGGGHMDWGGGWWVVMVFGMILFLGLVGLLIYFFLRGAGSRRDGGTGSGSDDALALLDRRLAEGAISPEEYHERRAILTGIEPDDSRRT